ncbi:unnamed protein product [Linum tenue]|nr:unnamed protein product [Linum tenue]
MRIAEHIGKPVRVDRATLEGASMNYARVCVEVDLTRPLLSKYKVEGVEYMITYEGLFNVCFDCGRYGAKTSACSCKLPTAMETVQEAVETMATVGDQEINQKPPLYGEWMIAKRKNRKPSMNPSNANNTYVPRKASGIQYEVLSEETGDNEEKKAVGSKGTVVRTEVPSGNRHMEIQGQKKVGGKKSQENQQEKRVVTSGNNEKNAHDLRSGREVEKDKQTQLNLKANPADARPAHANEIKLGKDKKGNKNLNGPRK